MVCLSYKLSQNGNMSPFSILQLCRERNTWKMTPIFFPTSNHFQLFIISSRIPSIFHNGNNLWFFFDISASVQSLSCVWLFATPWIAACQASLSITNSRSSPRLTSIESIMPSSHLILCHPLLLLPPIPPSIRVFSNESTFHMRRPKYWSFSFSIIPSKEIPGLISFRMDWLDLLAVPGTLKSLLLVFTWVQIITCLWIFRDSR